MHPTPADTMDLVGEDDETKNEARGEAPDLDWEEIGPQLYALLQEIIGGNKMVDDDKYTIEVSHEAVGKAHALLGL